jgi:polyferredoxin
LKNFLFTEKYFDLLKLQYLKKIRVVVSLLFLVLTAILFLDFTNLIPAEYFEYITFLQFVPSLIKFLSWTTPFAIGFIIILIITLLFGRVYCSTVCPLGTIQDMIIYLSKKLKKKHKFKNSEEFVWTRYSILILVVITFIAGNSFLLNLLDPYSNTGRILSQIFSPILLLLNNIFAFTLEKFNLYLIYPIEIKIFYLSLIIFPVLFISIVTYLSYKRGRLYCNTICPVGTLLGLISKFTIFKLKIDKSSCEGCGVCSNVCKAECIDKTGKIIDFSRCVACYNCLVVCPSDSINYKFGDYQYQSAEIEKSRRDFISRSSMFFVALTTSALSQIKIIPKKESTKPVIKNSFSSPPGSKSIDHFTSNCTACHLCVSACPTKVLQPSLLEWGVFGILQPFMDYHTSFCNYDCRVCSEVCPTGAISKITINQKEIVQIGRANFVKENCIVETENTACGACSEHCPTKAVMMVDYKNGLKIPEVKNEYCVGCGACEFACPVKPHKAIYVDGNLIHQIAEKRPTEKIEQNIDYKEEFPF